MAGWAISVARQRAAGPQRWDVAGGLGARLAGKRLSSLAFGHRLRRLRASAGACRPAAP